MVDSDVQIRPAAVVASTPSAASCSPSMPVTPLARFDVESIRVVHERTYAALVEQHPLFGVLSARLTAADPKEIRRHLMANSLRLSESMAPEAHRVAHEAQRILGVTGELEVYQRNGAENAAMHLSSEPILLEIQGALLPKLDGATMLGLFGHELGHFLAHGPHSGVRGARGVMPALGQVEDDDLTFALSRLSMMSELTADRVGLLACQDLHAMLRLEMVTLTGLASAELTWDTEAYLAQCKELIETALAEGTHVKGLTHPEHSLRAYALWLFSESRQYRELTGRGDGTRELAEVDEVIARCFGGTPDAHTSIALDYSLLGEPPRELQECALAAAVLVAFADGHLADEEREAIERNFSHYVADWQAYLDVEIAAERFRETASVLSVAGADLTRRLFLVLVRVMAADGEVNEEELGMIVSIGAVLGVEREYRRGLAAVLRTLGGTIAIESVAPVELPLPAKREDVESAFSAFLRGVLRRGESTITLRRLLRILGTDKRTEEHVEIVNKAFTKHGIKSSLLIADANLDDRIALTAPKLETSTKAQEVPPTRAGLLVALRRLREQLVSGDGRSPSVRLRQMRRGRAFDLMDLDKVSVGMGERVLAHVREGRSVRALDAADAGRHGPASIAATELLAIEREDAQRAEETGAHILYVGYPFLTGNVAGYAVRAPLVLYPVALERDGDGARGYKLNPRRDEPAIANQSLIRLIFNKRGFAFSDELSDELETLAGASDGGPEAVRRKLAAVGLTTTEAPIALQAFRDRDTELLERSDFLEMEEVAVLGLFPQSSSDLLQDYDGLLQDLSNPAVDLRQALAAAGSLLPQEMDGHVEPGSSTSAHQDWVPVIPADPSQRRVVAEARRHGAMVVDGPPGTGKSQVIVNLVAEALRRGERVAVVCEKRAALDVVRQRLSSIGLGKALGVVHDVNEDRKPLCQHIAARLEQKERIPFDAAEAERIRVEHEKVELALRTRLQSLGSKPAGLEVTLGELMTMTASRTSGRYPLVSGIGEVAQSHLPELMNTCAALHPFMDLWGEGTSWPSVVNGKRRHHLGEGSAHAISAIDMALSTAIAAAREYERIESVSPVSVVAVERARDALEVAHRARDARGSDRELFATVANLASRSPERLRAVADARDVWNRSSAALIRVETPVRFELAAPAVAALSVLRRLAKSWYRGFLVGWWKAKTSLRSELGKVWPERAGDDLAASLFSDLDDRLVSSKAWEALSAAFSRLELSRYLPARAADLPALLDRVASLGESLRELAANRALLEGAQAWIPGASEEALTQWDQAVDQRRQLLSARDRLAAAALPVVRAFPWLDAQPRALQLEALLDRWRRDATRLTESDSLLHRIQSILPSAPSLLDALHREHKSEPPAEWRLHVQRAWVDGWLARLEMAHPGLAKLGSGADDREVERLAARLRELENERRELEIERVLSSVDDAGLMNVDAANKGARRTPEQKVREDMLKEARKQRMLLPLRTFVRRFAPQGLLDVVPVWLLSPETMAVLFPRQPLFDLIVFDEASQCTVESGLPVLLRAKRVVIAGDEKQMPPSSYFSLGGNDEEEAAAATNTNDETKEVIRDLLSAESLLSLARPRVARTGLDWHYRCKEEALIAFSNHSMYQGELLTIPSTAGVAAPSPIHWVSVDGGVYESGENKPEAERVVDVVDDLIGRDAKQTIGVVTFNLKQRKAVLDAIDTRRSTDQVFRERLAQANDSRPVDERMFVKNLEQVQGDERDVIIFSLGHAPRERMRGGVPTGQTYVPARFGPLGQRGGERRLNVAISRAKSRCYVVASFAPSQLTVATSKHSGPRLFKQFLEFSHHLHHEQRLEAARVLDLVREAARTPRVARTRPALEGFIPLKTQVSLALEAASIPYEVDIGTSGFQIPIAILDPNNPARHALAVLLDESGDAATPFEVHVHRPGVLRQRGWDVLTLTAATWHRRRSEVLEAIAALVPGCRGAANNEIYTQYREQRRRGPTSTGITTPNLRLGVTKIPEVRTGPVVIAPGDVPTWALSVEDALFRKALLHLHRHGSMNEGELTSLVGGPRRARLFASSLDGWRSLLPFTVDVTSADGSTIYRATTATTASGGVGV